MTDIDALRRYADRGDPKAFEHLVRQYQAMVLAMCRRRLSNPDDVDDAVQETFVKLAKNARRIRSNVAAWLHRCALNTALDLVRKNTIRRKHEAVPSVVVQGEQDTEWAEIRQHLDEAINALNKDQKRLIVEHFFLGRTQSDLAEVLGVSQSSIHRRIQRAVQHLRQQLHRRGVVVTAAALSGFCVTATANAAVGPVLSANLAKIGLAGVGLTPAPAITTGVLTMATLTGKTKIVALAVVLGVMLFGAGASWVGHNGPDRSGTSPSAEVDSRWVGLWSTALPDTGEGTTTFSITDTGDFVASRWLSQQQQRFETAGKLEIDTDANPHRFRMTTWKYSGSPSTGSVSPGNVRVVVVPPSIGSVQFGIYKVEGDTITIVGYASQESEANPRYPESFNPKDDESFQTVQFHRHEKGTKR